MPIENAAGLDDETWRMDFARNNTLRVNLHSALGENDSVETSRDDDVVSLDLPFDARALSQHKSLRGNDCALYLCLQAKRAAEFEGTFKANSPV